jgi:hydroxyacylglutathione hydrolase
MKTKPQISAPSIKSLHCSRRTFISVLGCGLGGLVSKRVLGGAAGSLVKRFRVTVGTAPRTFTENVYVVHNTKTLDAVLIDPGTVSRGIEKYVYSNRLKVRRILNTHGHFDHIGGNGYYASLFRVSVSAHALDRGLYRSASKKDTPDDFFSSAASFRVPGFDTKVLHTPGHSEGSVCFLIDEHLFSGDTLFRNSIGRTWGKSQSEILSNREKEVLNIKRKILILPKNTMVFPGHGEDTTVGYEKLENPFL